mmetsp:Transcript_49975/g.128615  ORF Transcript_49975/g.128615 Transcript_49975/m.128615 type:complete len:223 (+) Transcript_49975:2095-2763(+)
MRTFFHRFFYYYFECATLMNKNIHLTKSMFGARKGGVGTSCTFSRLTFVTFTTTSSFTLSHLGHTRTSRHKLVDLLLDSIELLQKHVQLVVVELDRYLLFFCLSLLCVQLQQCSRSLFSGQILCSRREAHRPVHRRELVWGTQSLAPRFFDSFFCHQRPLLSKCLAFVFGQACLHKCSRKFGWRQAEVCGSVEDICTKGEKLVDFAAICHFQSFGHTALVLL